jgi:hypothetical protein
VDADRFDDLTRGFARSASRRAVLRGIVASLAAGLTGVRSRDAQAQTARRPAGAPCTRNAECGSRFCADGVCCDAPCAGQCEARQRCLHPGQRRTGRESPGLPW